MSEYAGPAHEKHTHEASRPITSDHVDPTHEKHAREKLGHEDSPPTPGDDAKYDHIDWPPGMAHPVNAKDTEDICGLA